MDGTGLLLSITGCPVVDECLNGAHSPCSAIVAEQAHVDRARHQVPEPWAGRLLDAPILFLSSNPSISFDEPYPTLSSSDDYTVAFFEHRFGGGPPDVPFVKDGTRFPTIAGGHSQRAVPFWAGVKKHAEVLLERPAEPGVDYAITEVVHCKSRQELGVRQAVAACTERHLGPVLRHSPARVVVVLGRVAADALAARDRSLFPDNRPGTVVFGVLEGRARHIVFMPHTNAHGPRKLQGLLDDAALEALRAALRPQRAQPSDARPW